MSEHPRNPRPAERVHTQWEWARLLLGSLADAGVRHVVISPGSRSTPFVLAASHEPRLRLHDIVDERCAAFFALGIGRATGRPALLLCTSGTAGAHYLPAVIEAGMARIPLLALTADRPVELVDCGANQAIDQLKLFGDHARAFVDLGLADDHPDALRGLRRMAAQAVFRSTWPEAGTVHLGARARKPLEPPVDEGGADEGGAGEIRSQVDALLERPIVRPSKPCSEPRSADLDALAGLCQRLEKGLIVAGPAPLGSAALADPLHRLAERLGWPLLADSTSQLRRPGPAGAGPRIDAYDPLLAALSSSEKSPVGKMRQAEPELVIQVGRPPTSGAWGRWLGKLGRSEASVHHWILTTDGFPDAESTATRLLVADPLAVVEGLLARLPAEMGAARLNSAWSRQWRRWSELGAGAIEASLADPRGEGVDDLLSTARALGEGQVARAAWRAVPAGGLLMVGNSLAIRLLDTYGSDRDVEGEDDAEPVGVLSQRGASGIDGLVSGAAGACVATGRPTLVYLGDLSLQHDLGGLAHLPPGPFVVLTVANGGGRIFEQLPLARHPASEGRFEHWTTPVDRDFAPLAEHFGLAYRRVESAVALNSVLDEAFREGGSWLVEAVVPPHGAADERRRLVAEIGRRLAEDAS